MPSALFHYPGLLHGAIAAVMNYITADSAVSVFPQQTLFRRESYVTSTQKKQAKWIDKYAKRGYKVIHSGNYDTASPLDVTTCRFPGDFKCFSIQFSRK